MLFSSFGDMKDFLWLGYALVVHSSRNAFVVIGEALRDFREEVGLIRNLHRLSTILPERSNLVQLGSRQFTFFQFE